MVYLMASWFLSIIRKYFEVPIGFLIDQPTEIITMVRSIHFTRKTIKHLVDQRKKDGLSLEEIETLFKRISECYRAPDLRLPNHNKNYPTSALLVKFYPNENRGLVVVYIMDADNFLVITAFYRLEKKILKLKNSS